MVTKKEREQAFAGVKAIIFIGRQIMQADESPTVSAAKAEATARHLIEDGTLDEFVERIKD